jgi:hypothetical protein
LFAIPAPRFAASLFGEPMAFSANFEAAYDAAAFAASATRAGIGI